MFRITTAYINCLFSQHILEKIKDQREFIIVGYSFGCLIAIELAKLLETKNISGRLILIDGAPDQMKFWVEQYFYHTSQQELQNMVLLGLMNMYSTAFNKEMVNTHITKTALQHCRNYLYNYIVV